MVQLAFFNFQFMSVTQGCESSDFILISDVFCSSQNPIFRLLMQFECIEKHIFPGISDYFRIFLTAILTPLVTDGHIQDKVFCDYVTHLT